MDAVWQKIKADIISRPVISLLILVTIVTSAALLTLALVTLMNINAPYDKAFEDLNAAHVWLYFDRERVSMRDVERIESLPGVAESTGLQYSALSRVRIRETQIWVSLRAIPLETLAVNRLLIKEGRSLAPHQEELLAGKDLDDSYGLSAGEVIIVTREDGREVTLPVVGLAYNPMWDIYRTSQPPYIYVSESTLRELFPNDSIWDWSMGLRLTDPNAVDEMVALIEETLHPDAVEGHTDWRNVRESAVFDLKLNFIFLGGFSSFATLAAILVIASSIGSIVLAQFRQIGILKAIGFTGRQILLIYVGQHLVLGLVGSFLGLLLGLALSPLALQTINISLSTTFRPPLNFTLVALVVCIVSGVVVLATSGAAHQGAQANIVHSIAIGAEAPRKRSPWPVRLAVRLGLPMVLILGLNDVFAKPFRSLLTGSNLTVGVIGVVFGLALTQTVNTYQENPALVGIVYDAAVTRGETSDSKTQHLLRNAPGVEAFYSQYVVEADTLSGQSFRIQAVEGDLEAFPFRIEEGRLFRPNSHEAVAGRGLLDWLGLEVGDEITVTFEDRENRPITWQVVGWYPEISDAGQIMMVSLPTVARTVKGAEPSSYFLKLTPDCDTAWLKTHLRPKPDSDLSVTFVDKVPDEIVYLQLAIFTLSGILIGIALVNVFNTSLLTVREKVRVIGILKTVGMTPAQVVAMANTAAGFLGLLAAVFGVPLGLIFTAGLLNALSATYGTGKVNVVLNLPYSVGLIPVMILVSMIGSIIPGQWAAKVPIVNVLRSE